jgi:hypothetical protein
MQDGAGPMTFGRACTFAILIETDKICVLFDKQT